MADFAHTQTDALLSEMEGKVTKVYKQALEESKEKLRKMLDNFSSEDAKMATKVASGEIKKRDYIRWRRETIIITKHYSDTIATLTEDLTRADKIAMRIVRGYMPGVYALNANYETYSVEQMASVDTGFTLYDKDTVERLLRDDPDLLPMPKVDIPLDKRWNKSHINNAITQGILQGDSIPNIAKRMETVVNMGHNAAIRNARTATTGAENAGRVASYKRAKSMGINLMQEWMATLDGRTRHEHRILDGKRVPVDGEFEVNGDKIRYPGDPRAPGYLIYNCRCTLIAALYDFDQSDAPRHSLLLNQTYEEWENAHERTQTVNQQRDSVI